MSNRLGTDLHTVEATVLEGKSDLSATVPGTPDGHAIGESGAITVQVDPDSSANYDGTIAVRLVVAGDKVRVTLTRSVPADCPDSANG